MKFGMNPSPYYRSKRSTSQIMLELLIGLAVIWACAIVYYFTTGTSNGIRAILNPIVAMVSAVIVEALFMLPKHLKAKGNFKGLLVKLLKSYGYISGLILALLLPVATSIYAIVISTIVAIGVGKMLFGGFGYNIFNPAIFGRIFCQTCFLSKMAYDTEIATGSTVTTFLGNSGWSLEMLEYGDFSLGSLLLGNYRGALGETFTIIILVVGIALMIRKVIDWRAPVFYLGSIFVGCVFMGLLGGYGLDAFEYALVQISVGGIMFGAIFCITDPVTSPTSPSGRVTFALGAAIITMLIRFLGSAPEGVAYSILIMNALTPLIDAAVKGLSNQFGRKKIVTASVLGALVIGTGLIAGSSKIDKAFVVNYRQNEKTETGDLKADIKKLSKKNGISKYQVSVTGVLNKNEAVTIGDVKQLFATELEAYQKYFNDASKYENPSLMLGSGNSLQIVYSDPEQNGKAVTVDVIYNDNKVVLTPIRGETYWTIAGKETTLKVEEYNYAIYSTAIVQDDEGNFMLVVTFASDHKKEEENFLAYSTMVFNVDVDYKHRTINKTEFVSTSAVGDGVNDKMGDGLLDGTLTFSGIIDYFSPSGDDRYAVAFYNKYIKVESPVSFDVYTSYKNGSFLELGEGDIRTGVSYTANAYMYLMNTVIEYATYDNTVGKVKI